MMQRREKRDYLDDHLAAKALQREENEKFEQRKHLKSLEDKASQAGVDLLIAEMNGENTDELIKILAQMTLALEHARAATSTAGVTKKLAENKKNNAHNMTAVKPIRIFTKLEMEKINAHYQTLPEDLRKLLDLTVTDERVTFELMPNPAFIRGEGHLYNMDNILALLEGKGEARSPMTQKVFKKSDIIPCNTLIEAMVVLLNIINKETEIKEIPKTRLATLHQERIRIPEEIVRLIEIHYKYLEDKHKVLFDIICRDPITKTIMDDPVFTPDGRVCNKGTAMAYLKYGECPSDSSIPFNEDDMTPCYFVREVLDQLQANIKAKMKLVEATVEHAAQLRL